MPSSIIDGGNGFGLDWARTSLPDLKRYTFCTCGPHHSSRLFWLDRYLMSSIGPVGVR